MNKPFYYANHCFQFLTPPVDSNKRRSKKHSRPVFDFSILRPFKRLKRASKRLLRAYQRLKKVCQRLLRASKRQKSA